MRNPFNFFQDNIKQDKHYTYLIEKRVSTRCLFSCGYYERFDPFMLDKKPFLVPVYEKIFMYFFPEQTGNLLDVGCGTGLYWPILSKYCRYIVGVDFSKAMVDEARRLIETKGLTNIEVKVQNSENLDFSSESFDSILCMDVLHHIPDIKRAINNFYRVLKPKGRLLAVEPNTLNPLIFFAHLIPSEERLAILRNYGPLLKRLFSPYFKNIKIHYVNFVASAASEKQLKRVEAAGRIISAISFLRLFSLRQLIIMEKRENI
jgi:ubiquinone/menaquinone biosynthesis C-methylase UbiE